MPSIEHNFEGCRRFLDQTAYNVFREETQRFKTIAKIMYASSHTNEGLYTLHIPGDSIYRVHASSRFFENLQWINVFYIAEIIKFHSSTKMTLQPWVRAIISTLLDCDACEAIATHAIIVFSGEVHQAGKGTGTPEKMTSCCIGCIKLSESKATITADILAAGPVTL